jgi:protease IV
MQRALLPVWLILALCVSVSFAQTSTDKPASDKNQSNTEQADNKKSDADKAKAEKEAAKAKIEAVKAKIKARLKAEQGKIEATAAEIEAAVKAEEEKNDKDEKSSMDKKSDAKTDSKEADNDKEESTATKKAELKFSISFGASTDKEDKDAADGKDKQTAKKSDGKKVKVVCFTLRGEYSEGPTSADLFSEMSPSLSDIIERIDAAAKDKEVAAVWLKFDDLSLGRGKTNELRAAIARLRKANKPIYAELTTADAGQYLVASACNEIIMPESGMLIVPGVRAEMMFYKGFLDKIGVEYEDLKMGKYKGALEPMTRNEMSQPLRESMEAIVDDIYNEMVSNIAADRHLNDVVVKSLLDHALYNAEGAKNAGLIDQVLYTDQFEQLLPKKLNTKSLDIVTNYKTKTIDTDFSGISGFMKLMEMMTGGKPSEKAGKKQKIAVVYAIGTIMEGRSSSSIFGENVLGSNTLIAALRKASENPTVAAVVLRIDSPGGSATASDMIWRETVRLKKPMIASMGDVAGSGGYYIAMGAKKIYAEPGTLTGSIGVIGGKPVFKGLYDKLGLNTEIISRGANSGANSTTNPFTPAERRAWIEMLQGTYHQFVTKAAEGRKMPYDKVHELAQGRVYTGAMAKKIGLIDDLGTLEDAIAAAKTAAGLKPDADVDILILPQPKSILEQLFGDQSADAETDTKISLPMSLDLLGEIKIIRQFLSEPVLTWMPFRVVIK